MSTILKRLRFFLLSTIPFGTRFHHITAFLDVYRTAIQQHSYLLEERESFSKSSKFLLCNGSGPSPHEITVVREKPGSDWFRPYSWTHQQQRWGNCHDYQVPLLDVRSNLGLESQTWGSLWKKSLGSNSYFLYPWARYTTILNLLNFLICKMSKKLNWDKYENKSFYTMSGM